jgi:hypothetical protein
MWGLRANLDEVVEDPEALRVLAGLDIDEGADLGGGEGDMLPMTISSSCWPMRSGSGQLLLSSIICGSNQVKSANPC